MLLSTLTVESRLKNFFDVAVIDATRRFHSKPGCECNPMFQQQPTSTRTGMGRTITAVFGAKEEILVNLNR